MLQRPQRTAETLQVREIAPQFAHAAVKAERCSGTFSAIVLPQRTSPTFKRDVARRIGSISAKSLRSCVLFNPRISDGVATCDQRAYAG